MGKLVVKSLIVADRLAAGETLEQIFPEWAKRVPKVRVEETAVLSKKTFKFIEVSVSTLTHSLARKLIVELGLAPSFKQGQRVIEQNGFRVEENGIEKVVARHDSVITPRPGMIFRVGKAKVLITE